MSSRAPSAHPAGSTPIPSGAGASVGSSRGAKIDFATAMAAATRAGAAALRAARPCDTPDRRLGRNTTGRRLFFAFSALVGGFLVSLFLASSGLRRIERALEAMRSSEERVRLALELESTVRDQYAHEAHGIRRGEDGDLGESRRRAGELLHLLRERVGGVEERGWVDEIEQAVRDLEAILDERVVAKSAAGDTVSLAAAHERAYPLVTVIEDRVDRFFARQNDATVQLRGKVSALQRSMLRWTLAFLLGAPLFAIAVGLYIRRSVARPVALLGQGAARLARGDLETRIDIHSDDEFGALARQFNCMTESLKRNQEALVQAEKLASADRLAAGVAHELNNPLSVMLGYLTLHRREATGRLANSLWLVEREALRCREIVRGLLDMSRPSCVLDPLPVDMRELCDEVVAGLRDSGQLPAARVSVEGTGTAAGDRSKLRQVLVNLLKNAADAAGSKGTVGVRVASSQDSVEVAVTDSGPGIAPTARSRIFEPFFTTKASGTGLGLAVSRAIARAHGGDITMGKADAGGALFALCVPRRPERRP